MDEVIKAGLPTKVLLLSATPVNNDLSDLKAQLDLISSYRSPNVLVSMGVDQPITSQLWAQGKYIRAGPVYKSMSTGLAKWLKIAFRFA